MRKLLPTITLSLLLLTTTALAGETGESSIEGGECDHSTVVEFVCDLFGMGCD